MPTLHRHLKYVFLSIDLSFISFYLSIYSMVRKKIAMLHKNKGSLSILRFGLYCIEERKSYLLKCRVENEAFSCYLRHVIIWFQKAE